MNELHNKKELEKEEKERLAIARENRLLNFVLPITGVIAFILGVVGFILTLNSGQTSVMVFYIVLLALGLLGCLYGVVLLIRKKKPNFLKREKKEAEDSVLPD